MADTCGVSQRITYSEDNPISKWLPRFRRERELLGRWLGFRAHS